MEIEIKDTKLFFKKINEAKEFINTYSKEDFWKWEADNDYGGKAPVSNWRKETKIKINDSFIVASIQYDSNGDDMEDDLWFAKTIYFNSKKSIYNYSI